MSEPNPNPKSRRIFLADLAALGGALIGAIVWGACSRADTVAEAASTPSSSPTPRKSGRPGTPPPPKETDNVRLDGEVAPVQVTPSPKPSPKATCPPPRERDHVPLGGKPMPPPPPKKTPSPSK